LSERDLLRFMTAGSVDDGKSTLIGRLLYESNGVYDDQLSAVRNASVVGSTELDLSLITDGLRSEREQGITIDVAYRYFSTPKRKFIIADTPGHEQYTRNMATGASTAQLALILVDARKGVLQQTRRHTLIAWLFGIRQMIVAVNKMDLVNFDADTFSKICEDFNQFTSTFHNAQIQFVPLSALTGENVVSANGSMPWYQGSTLLELLESTPVQALRNNAFRLPVQNVIRPNQNFRGYAGQVISGRVKPGKEVIALPSRQRTTVKEVHLFDRKLDEATAPRSVVLTLVDHIDLGRGDMLADPESAPTIATRVTACMIWMSPVPLRIDNRYLIKHTTQMLCGRILGLNHRIDINTFEKTPAEMLRLNEIGEAEIELHTPFYCDTYEQDRTTGAFIVIDPLNNDTVAAAMITEIIPQQAGELGERPTLMAHTSRQRGLTIWFTGLSGAGKTTLCNAVQTELLALGLMVEVIDGDVIRKHLCKDLGFSREDRNENIRRIAFVAHLLARNGTTVLVSAISPYREARDEARHTIGDLIEVFVSAPLSVCEERDPKGLYKKARAGTIKCFTGIDDPYEPPVSPEIVCDTEHESVRESTAKVTAYVKRSLSSKALE
jgi:bifunctional enzyme CysN/CysC